MAYPQLTDKAGALATALAIRTRKISVAEAVDAAITRAGRDDAVDDDDGVSVGAGSVAMCTGPTVGAVLVPRSHRGGGAACR